MKIIYLHQHFTTREGRSGTRSYEFSKHLADSGHQVFMITGIYNLADLKVERLIEHRTVEGINLIIINVPYSNQMSYLRRLISFLSFSFIATYAALRVKAPDIVFATSTPLTIGIPAYLVKKMKRVPFVFELRDLWPDYAVAYGALKNRQLVWLARRLETILYRGADRIVTICETIKESIVAKGVDPLKVTVIPIGADTEDFYPGDKSLLLKRSQGIGGDDFVVSYVGAHSTVNALDSVIDCAAISRDEHLKFLFVGDGRSKAVLTKRASNLRNVLFMDSQPRSSVPEIMRSSDLCVITALDIPAARAILPNKFFDYISCGRPVLINFEGELADILRSERIGIVVPNGDASEMLKAIENLKRDPDELAAMGERARRLAVDRFNRKKLATELERTLTDCLEK